MGNPTLLGLVIVSAILTIRAKYRGPLVRVWIFKPLTMLLILWAVVSIGIAHSAVYFYLILSGLVFSLAGDVFLMLPKERFIPGLAAFLVAHLFYASAFTFQSGFGWTWWILSPLLIFGSSMLVLLLPHTGKMKIPVTLYMLVILIMVWQAWERWNRLRQGNALLAAIGAVLFLFSDSLLAWNRFRKSFKSAEVLKLGSYFTAQWMIAISVGG